MVQGVPGHPALIYGIHCPNPEIDFAAVQTIIRIQAILKFFGDASFYKYSFCLES